VPRLLPVLLPFAARCCQLPACACACSHHGAPHHTPLPWPDLQPQAESRAGTSSACSTTCADRWARSSRKRRWPRCACGWCARGGLDVCPGSP